ncbi:MAG: VIT domain-containing protein [Nannocystales bacterium]
MGGKGFVSPKLASFPSPLSLTASDGSGLELISMSARAEIDDPVAVTHLELRFDNPKEHVVEGKLQLTLPPGASITHFAMKIGEHWQDAAVVERQAGRVAYEESLHQNRDPALLEKSSGNRFGVRVFPIAARGQVHLRVSYTQAFSEPSQPYRLALRGLPRVRNLSVRAGVLDTATGQRTWTEKELDRQRPTEDFIVQRADASATAWRHGEHLLARVVVPATQDVAVPTGGYTVLFDTSASRAVEFGLKVERLEQLLEELGERGAESAEVTVIPFDQSVGAPVYSGALSGYADSAASARLRSRGALGASNVGRALAAAAKQSHARVVLVTDGMLTAGARDAAGLRNSLLRVSKAGAQRLDVIASRDLQDDTVLHNLVTTALPQDGVVVDASQSIEAVAMRLLRPTAPPLKVRIEGASRVFPTTLAGVQQGDAVLVYAHTESKEASVEVRLSPTSGEVSTQRLDVATRDDADFERGWLRAHVEDQLESLAAGGQPDLEQLVALSVEHKILNDLTALIVLETDQDYERFGFETSGEEAPSQAPAGSSPGKSLSLDEFKNIPVGRSSSRDFTAVVESSATASRDSARISLAGSTSAESSHVVERGRGRRAPPSARVEASVGKVRGDFRRPATKSYAAVAGESVDDCYFDALNAGFSKEGKMTVELQVSDGVVVGVDLLRDRLGATQSIRRCMDQRLRTLNFGGKTGRVRMSFSFHEGWVPEQTVSFVSGIPGDGRTVFEGQLRDVLRLVAMKRDEEAEALARRWQRESPDDLMALTALGRAAEARGKTELAARAYGSIAELHPSSAPMLRFSAGRLQALGPRGLELATDLLREAQRQRPDHPSSHRSLAWVHVQRQQYGKAFKALVDGFDRDYPDGRFASAKAALADELSVVAAAWVRSEPGRRAEVDEKLGELGLSRATEPSLRFVLTWETDANDVDLHVRDGRGSEASYALPALPSGGDLLADVTNGFGPETFVIQGTPRAYPYDLFVHYYARGPMGYGMGQVQTVFHDGKGMLEIDTLPYVVMNDDAMLGVGSVAAR